MSDGKHTAGPWRIDVNGSEKWSVDYDGPSSTYMTICGKRREPVAFAVEPSAYGNDEELEANARLIAAAPDLLEAAQQALASMLSVGVVHDGDVHQGDPAIANLRSAILRATGEGA